MAMTDWNSAVATQGAEQGVPKAVAPSATVRTEGAAPSATPAPSAPGLTPNTMPTTPSVPTTPTPTTPTQPTQPMTGSDYLASALGVAGSAGTTFSDLMQPGQLQTQNLAEPLQRQLQETMNTAHTAAVRRMRGLTNPAPGVHTDLAGRVLNSDGTIAKNAQQSVFGRVDRNKGQQTDQNTQANTQQQQSAQPVGGAVAQQAGVTMTQQNGKNKSSYTYGNTTIEFDESITWGNDEEDRKRIAENNHIVDSMNRVATNDREDM